MKTNDLIEEVTSLPVEERAMVADRILRSLNPPDSKIDEKWAAVARRRLAEISSGQMSPVHGDAIFARIWKQYGQ